LAGGLGEDVPDGGPGADEIDTRNRRKDTIAFRFGEGDVGYYDRGLDVLESPVSGYGRQEHQLDGRRGTGALYAAAPAGPLRALRQDSGGA
jgi:hypothetical protein